MASTSAPRSDAGASRIKSAASTLCYDNQTLLADIRKAMGTMKEIGISLERQHKTQMVNELEAEFMELLKAYEDCANLSSAIDSVGNTYRPNDQVFQLAIHLQIIYMLLNSSMWFFFFWLDFVICSTILAEYSKLQLTNFKTLLDNEMAKKNRRSSSVSQVNQLLRQFREAIWNVHNSGQPMPGEEQEDIVMTSTQSILLNVTCPLSGKPVTELSEPVRSIDCKHIYEKKVIMEYLRSKNGQSKCPMAACPKIIIAERVVCDPLLRVEIEESRSMNNQATRPNIIEDFTDESEKEDSD